MNEIGNQVAAAKSQVGTQGVAGAPEPARTARNPVGDAILNGPNVEITIAMMGIDAALQTARNMGVTPEQAAERRRRDEEQRKEDDLKDDRGEELAEEELERERQVTENIVAAETMAIRA